VTHTRGGDTDQIDRLAHSDRLFRSLHLNAVDAAVAHFTGLVPIALVKNYAVEADPETLCAAAIEMAALEEVLAGHEREILDAIATAGHSIAPVLDQLRQLDRARKEIATQLAPTIACGDVSDAVNMLTEYASSMDEELAQGKPLVGLMAYLQRNVG
jgi:hypothetical protein